jgi:hypothetical protein
MILCETGTGTSGGVGGVGVIGDTPVHFLNCTFTHNMALAAESIQGSDGAGNGGDIFAFRQHNTISAIYLQQQFLPRSVSLSSNVGTGPHRPPTLPIVIDGCLFDGSLSECSWNNGISGGSIAILDISIIIKSSTFMNIKGCTNPSSTSASVGGTLSISQRETTIGSNVFAIIDHCHFHDCYVDGVGLVYFQNINATITSTRFDHNMATGPDAAGVIVVRTNRPLLHMMVKISNVTITDNRVLDIAQTSMGGAIKADSVDLMILDTHLERNTIDGAGSSLYIINSHVDVMNTWIMNHESSSTEYDPQPGSGGDGTITIWNSHVLITNCTINGNKVSHVGSVCSVSGNATLIITNSTIIGNECLRNNPSSFDQMVEAQDGHASISSGYRTAFRDKDFTNGYTGYLSGGNSLWEQASSLSPSYQAHIIVDAETVHFEMDCATAIRYNCIDCTRNVSCGIDRSGRCHYNDEASNMNALSTCCKTCVNGYCHDNECVCPEGTFGDTCSINRLWNNKIQYQLLAMISTFVVWFILWLISLFSISFTINLSINSIIIVASFVARYWQIAGWIVPYHDELLLSFDIVWSVIGMSICMWIINIIIFFRFFKAKSFAVVLDFVGVRNRIPAIITPIAILHLAVMACDFIVSNRQIQLPTPHVGVGTVQSRISPPSSSSSTGVKSKGDIQRPLLNPIDDIEDIIPHEHNRNASEDAKDIEAHKVQQGLKRMVFGSSSIDFGFQILHFVLLSQLSILKRRNTSDLWHPEISVAFFTSFLLWIKAGWWSRSIWQQSNYSHQNGDSSTLALVFSALLIML